MAGLVAFYLSMFLSLRARKAGLTLGRYKAQRGRLGHKALLARVGLKASLVRKAMTGL
jgi:hypothetical protein